MLICAPIVSGDEFLPQLLAQIASLDRDHTVSLQATSNGVDLVLAHDGYRAPVASNGQSLVASPSHPAHVFHIITGPATAKQPTLPVVSNALTLLPHFSPATAADRWTFVPPLPLAYSRPPPGEGSVRLDRPALAGLLI